MLPTASIATLIMCLAASPSLAYMGEELAGDAKIAMVQAEAIALKARPGEVTDRELEKERGGSGLRYSFNINSGGKAYEVGIGANTGKVLENAAEGTARD